MAPFVIAVAIPKGGTGKTTISHALAHAAAVEDLRVVLLDSDSQGNAIDWAETAAVVDGQPLPYQVLVAPATSITRWINRNGTDVDVVIIDGHPRDDEHNRAAARNADLVLIPTGPGALDILQVKRWAAWCRAEDKPTLVVLNQVPAHSFDGPIARERLAEDGIRVAEAEMGFRVGIMRSAGSRPGRLLTNFAQRLWDEIAPQ